VAHTGEVSSSGSSVSLPGSKKYMTWSKEDTERLATQFMNYIKKDVNIPLSLCNEIKADYTPRTAKKIQDKIKTLRKQYKKSN
jgi:hypothetical protein